jgi:drug/metabolite transporter (DMT)-like permease
MRIDFQEHRLMTGSQPLSQELSLGAGLYTVLLCMIFGSNAVAAKMAFSGVGVFTSAALRFAIAAAGLFIWIRATGQTIGASKGDPFKLFVFAALFTLQLALFYFGLSKSNASRGTLITNLLPFFILFLAHFFIPGDRITGRKLGGILLGFGGVVCLFWGPGANGNGFLTGDLIILAGTMVWACSTVYLKRIIADFHPVHLVMYQMVFAIPFLSLAALLWDRPMVSNLDASVVGALLFQGLIASSFGFVAWSGLLQKYGAFSLHTFVFIMPIAGVFFGGLILGEPITLKILLALAFIVGGILAVQWRSSPRESVKRSQYVPKAQ